MTLPLTPEMLIGAYEFLRTTPPYRGWKLPTGDEVKFAVTKHKTFMATHQGDVNGCAIEMSAALVGHTATLVQTMGHEMIHLYQYLTKRETGNTIHNADFRRKAESACRYHGWDLRIFI